MIAVPLSSYCSIFACSDIWGLNAIHWKDSLHTRYLTRIPRVANHTSTLSFFHANTTSGDSNLRISHWCFQSLELLLVRPDELERWRRLHSRWAPTMVSVGQLSKNKLSPRIRGYWRTAGPSFAYSEGYSFDIPSEVGKLNTATTFRTGADWKEKKLSQFQPNHKGKHFVDYGCPVGDLNSHLDCAEDFPQWGLVSIPVVSIQCFREQLVTTTLLARPWSSNCQSVQFREWSAWWKRHFPIADSKILNWTTPARVAC